MDINFAYFNTDIGRKKPENIIHKDASCPFCKPEQLTGIIAADGDIILLRNKYNVLEGADQYVLIEGKECDTDMPHYTSEHMHRLIAFGMMHWSRMRRSGKYDTVLFFKNYGHYSGGTRICSSSVFLSFNRSLHFSTIYLKGLRLRSRTVLR